MTQTQTSPRVETVQAKELYPLLHKVPAFADVAQDDLACVGPVELVHAEAGSDLIGISGTSRAFWAVLTGKIRLQKIESDGTMTPLGTFAEGDTMGEVPLLVGKTPQALIDVVENATLVLFREDAFWTLMSSCPAVRYSILGNMARRLQVYQTQALHREKLISLGTLAAGLMHELNNPGSAARRAASQMRENLGRLQQVSLRFCSHGPLTAEQSNCLRELQEQAIFHDKPKAVSSLEQSDAEECLADWLEQQGVENAWKLAPTLNAIGFDRGMLECARHEFPGSLLSDSLNWLEALTSSVQLVGTIEESISRVTDLVHAVKKYAYEDKSQRHQVDVHDSIQSTLVILGHKFRHKELTVEKRFAPDLPLISTSGAGLNQVWTNLLDNAIDAAPQKGSIVVRTWTEDAHVCIGIADNGPGIAPEHLNRIFEPFFTTKPVGVGTGLGLDIVHRIVVGQFGGLIRVDSVPGRTEFIVMLPLKS